MLPTLIVIASFLLFVVFWYGIFVLLARLGGWSAIAAQYSATEIPAGKVFRMQSATFRWVDYNGCLTITLCAAGLGISLMPIFRIRHPTLFLPWSALHVIEVRNRWYRRDVTIAVGAPPIARIRLPLKIMEEAGKLRNMT